MSSRTQPNIIVTGTPGVGKTSHCELLAQKTSLKHLSINDVVKDKSCHEGFDEEMKSYIVDEDKVISFFTKSLYTFAARVSDSAYLECAIVAGRDRRPSQRRRLYH
jgi:broad-specificity NMP kinase